MHRMVEDYLAKANDMTIKNPEHCPGFKKIHANKF